MLIDRINAWLISRLPSRRARLTIVVTDTGLQVTGEGRDELIAWSRIQRVVVTRAAQVVGDTLLVVVGIDDARALTVPADSPAWSPLTTVLPRHLSGARPYEEWGLALTAAAPDTELTVFSR
jgi:hypothetical protein